MLLYFKITLSLFPILIFPFSLKGQNNSIYCKTIASNDTLEVFTFIGSKTIKSGHLTQDNNSITIPDNYFGFIRISSKEKYQDIIFENETLEISIDNESDFQIIAHSSSNEMLLLLKKYYKEISSEISKTNDTEVKNSLFAKREKFTDSILNIDTNSFFSITTRLAVKPLSGLTSYDIIDELPLQNEMLLHCSVIPTYLLNSMRAIENADENELKNVLGYLFKKEMHPAIGEMISSFLIEFFSSTNSDAILIYLTEKILKNDYCSSELSLKATQKLEQIELYKPGKKLPATEINGKKIQKILKKYRNKEIILIIWSMDCPHCLEMLKRITTSKKKENYYIGIELSDHKELKTETVFDLSLKDNSGWKGKLAKDWMIDKTPTVFKINSDLTIIELPDP